MDFACHPVFCDRFSEYWLEVGDLAQARTYATRLHDMSVAAPDRNFLALAHRSLSRIAAAQGDLDAAGSHISRSVALLENTPLPFAAWRVYLSAAEYWRTMDDPRQAAEYRSRSDAIIRALADNFEHDDPLRVSLLTGFAAASYCPSEKS
jgi:ATP/maltotriose-dependent transcriptional regulator MalT